MKKVGAFLGVAVSIVYILNPTVGIVEFIPDNMPFFGNLDEAGATAILIWSLKTLFEKPENPNPKILDDNK